VVAWNAEAFRIHREWLLHREAISWLKSFMAFMGDRYDRKPIIEFDRTESMTGPADRVCACCGAWTVEYRPQYLDWVTWRGEQLEGTLLGEDQDFIAWCERQLGPG
jgi:hypothetical protein